MAKKLTDLASEISLHGGRLSGSLRYTSARASYRMADCDCSVDCSSDCSADCSSDCAEGNDNCDCYDGDCSDCYCTDCNEGSDNDN